MFIYYSASVVYTKVLTWLYLNDVYVMQGYILVKHLFNTLKSTLKPLLILM